MLCVLVILYFNLWRALFVVIYTARYSWNVIARFLLKFNMSFCWKCEWRDEWISRMCFRLCCRCTPSEGHIGVNTVLTSCGVSSPRASVVQVTLHQTHSTQMTQIHQNLAILFIEWQSMAAQDLNLNFCRTSSTWCGNLRPKVRLGTIRVLTSTLYLTFLNDTWYKPVECLLLSVDYLWHTLCTL